MKSILLNNILKIKMKKKAGAAVKIILWCLPAIFFTGLNTAHAQETITVPLESFSKISIGNSSKVKITQGDSYSISFEGKSDDAQWLKDAVEDDELKLKGRNLPKAVITFKKLEEIEIKGISQLSSTGPISAGDFKIDISGTGDVTLDLNAKDVEIDISGAGKLKLSGSADKLDLDISGAGDVTADDFKVAECNADISGSGHCTVNVTEELNSHISGSGSISYINPPARINKDISGMGHVGDDDFDNNGDTTRFSVGEKKILVINLHDSIHKHKMEKVQPHWAGIELGFNGYMTPDNKMFPEGYDFMQLDLAKSTSFSINFFDVGTKLYKRYVMLVTGFGLTYNNYRFRGDTILASGGNGIYGIGNTFNYSKNKLTVSYFTVPVLLEFNTSKYSKRSFHVSTGCIFGYRAGSHTKQVYEEEGTERKIKSYSQFSINPWRVDATLRAGYRDFTLFANYDMVPLFRDEKGPELHPYTVGITLVGW
jgi:hypothetical protein